MIKSFTNSKGVKYLFVEVPERAKYFSVTNKGLLFELGDALKQGGFSTLSLPKGNYQIIGLLKDLTEEQWKEVSNWIIDNHYQSVESVIMSLGFKESDNVLILEVKG